MWKVFSDPFMNDSKIFPTQQKDVKKIIDAYSKDSNVTKLIIFGSSVTSACNPWSDIDLYAELIENKNLPNVGLQDVALDAWTNYTVDSALMQEINKKGVVVYERNIAGHGGYAVSNS